MSLPNLTESNDLPVSPSVMCPFLGERYDSTTYSANDVVPNYCHRARPVAPVNLDHQILVCLTEEYKHCLVFTSTNGRSLPPEWLNEEEAAPVGLARWRTALIFAGIGLVVILLGVFLLRGWLFGASSPVANQDKITPSPTEMLLIDTDTPTATPTIPPTDTFTATLEPTATLTATPEPSMLTQTAAAFLVLTQQTQTQTTIGTDPCESDWVNQLTVQVFDPEYSPKHLDPPLTITYGEMPFLIRWQVQNTSKECTWNAVQLQTNILGQNKILTQMPSTHVQPYIDVEFAMRDKAMNLVSQVNPGQTVIISIQIDGMTLVNSEGKIDRSCDLLVNGHLLPAGNLKASLAIWATVKLPATLTPTSPSPAGPTQTPFSPTITPRPTTAPTLTPSPTIAPSPTTPPTLTPTPTTGPPPI